MKRKPTLDSLQRRISTLLRDLRAIPRENDKDSVRVIMRLLEAAIRELEEADVSALSSSAQKPTRSGMRPGPKPNIAKHARVAEMVYEYGGTNWGVGQNLRKLSDALTEARIPPPYRWRTPWSQMVRNDPDKVRKTIANHLKQFSRYQAEWQKMP